jgi:hypothetical protein
MQFCYDKDDFVTDKSYLLFFFFIVFTFKVGSSCMQGWRVNMEDSHTHILSLPDDPAAAFFAVYDGHGG